MQNRINALADFVGVEPENIKLDERMNGAFTIDTLDSEYLVLTDEEATQEAKEMIKNSLWAFNADFILKCCKFETSKNIIASLRSMQEKSCEDCNDFILALINGTCGFDYFAEAAIFADGRGHFISGYDGKEEENNGYYIYRIY